MKFVPVRGFFAVHATVVMIAACAGARQGGPLASAQAGVNELLRADRAFSAASAGTDIVGALSPMFTDDVVMPAPGGLFIEGKDSVLAAIRTNPVNVGVRLTWTPIRGGISGDGKHGFTFGYMTALRPDSAPVPLKYMSYWVKGPDGWRVVVYRRSPRAAGDVSLELMPPSLPARVATASADAATVKSHRESLAATEKAFSDEAQVIGLAPAFLKYGLPDAVNMGGPAAAAFVVGAEAISRAVTAGDPPGPSPVSWGADKIIVASSGDLGITMGVIRPNKQERGQPQGFSFFTIWRRDSVNDPWRYVAE